jgi:hypothetical protein
MVKTSCPPTPSKGFSASPRTEGPIRAPPRRALTISDSLSRYCYCLRDSPAPTMRPKSPVSVGFHDVGVYTVR